VSGHQAKMLPNLFLRRGAKTKIGQGMEIFFSSGMYRQSSKKGIFNEK
jgi:hypothetical protein